MEGYRAKISMKTDSEGLLNVHIDYVLVKEDETVVEGAPIVHEEFRISRERQDCSYISCVSIQSFVEQNGTFWLDAQGRRQFVLRTDAGNIQNFGGEVPKNSIPGSPEPIDKVVA